MAGRDREADRHARRCAALATDDDASAQVVWRQVRARVLARRGEVRRALELAREAIEIALTSDHLNLQADSMVDLAHRLRGSRRADEDATTALRTALGIYEAKGNAVRAREARRLLARPVSV